jgi:hypothetical protein
LNFEIETIKKTGRSDSVTGALEAGLELLDLSEIDKCSSGIALTGLDTIRRDVYVWESHYFD